MTLSNAIRRGDIYYADLAPVIGSEQGDVRPVLVVQNNAGNAHSPTTQIIPISKRTNKKRLPTHVCISKSCGLTTDSIALVEQLRTIDRSRLSGYIGRIGAVEQNAIDKALSVSVGIVVNRKDEIWDMTLCPRCKSEFEYGGYLLVKRGWQELKEPCDFCRVGRGWEYGVFEGSGMRELC